MGPYSNISVNLISTFLFTFFSNGATSSSINVARSALSFFLPYDLYLKDPTISRLFKYLYRERPLKAKYFTFWPVKDLFNHLSALHPIDTLSLKDLTLKKTLSLIALTSSDRAQTIHAMKVNSYVENNDNITFVIFDRLKHSRRVQKPRKSSVSPVTYPL